MTDEELRVLAERVEGFRTLIESQRADDKEALSKALIAAEKLADKHNDLIRAMQERDSTYLSVDVWKSEHRNLEERLSRMETLGARVVGGLVVIGAVGVLNLIRLFVG